MLEAYLRDPFLKQMYSEIRGVGPLRSIMLDITHVCNLRCTGCYFFAEGMDETKTPDDERKFDAFVEREKARGTNFITVAGGEPSLVLKRVKKLHDNFRVLCVTNGLRPIPREGFEDMAIALSLWGNSATDKRLRGAGKIDVFERTLANFKDDPRAFFYYTVQSGSAHEVEGVVEQCIANGNRVFFSYYEDLAGLGSIHDHRAGFTDVRRAIHRMIERYPGWILTTSYLSEVISSGRLYDETWGYDVCTNITVDHPGNADRLENGKPLMPHFRAYMPDLETTRRCCVGDARDCGTCKNTWTHMGWVMLNLEKHLGSAEEFTNWLTSVYVFYLVIRAVDHGRGVELLPEIHARQRRLRDVHLQA
jgi:4Fe-4S single cluster domain